MTEKAFLKQLHKDLKGEGLVTNTSDTSKIFKIVIDNLSNVIIKGIELRIQNFGIFSSKLVNRTNIQNLAAGPIKRWGIYFKASKLLKDKINGD